MAAPSLSLRFPSQPWQSRKNRFERFYRHRHLLDRLLVVLLFGMVALSVVWLAAPQQVSWTQPALEGMGILFLVTTGFWLALPAWFHSGFRRLAYRSALLVWRLRTLRRALPAAGAVLIAVSVLAAWWLYSLEGPDRAKEVTIALISILLLWFILFMRVQARKRLFVADFTNYASFGGEACGKAIAARLRNELSSIAALYRDIDEALPDSGAKIQSLSVSVQDTGADFKEVLGAGFTVPIFGFQLPVGALVSILGGRFWGPRLTGSLHEEGDRLVLVAEIGGGRMEGSWRVSTADLDEEDQGITGMSAAYKLAEQMAYRVLTSQMNIGSPRWEAVHFFTEGLRAYRRVRRTEKDKPIYLRKAERAFIRARNEDNLFAQCHYDLGVVYRELEQPDSAESAFRQIVEKDPERFDPYIGLATLDLDRKDFRNAGIHAEKALRILPGNASAWNLVGLARVWAEGDPKTVDAWDYILMGFGMATGLAWRTLCREILRSGPGAPEAQARMRLAQVCTGNLAEALAHRARCLSLGDGECRRSASLFSHALSLQPQNPILHFSLGQTLFQARRWSDAKEAFYEAFGEALEPEHRALRWAYLAATHAFLSNSGGVQSAYRNFLDFAVPCETTILTAERQRDLAQDKSYKDAMEALSKDLDRIGGIPKIDGNKDYFDSMKRVAAFLEELETGTFDESRYREERDKLDEDDRRWGNAQISIRTARKLLEERPGEAFRLLSEAVTALNEEKHHRQVEKQGLKTLMAQALLGQARLLDDSGRLNDALRLAEESSEEEPASAVRRWVLSEAYSALKDFEQVSQESETSLALGSAAHLLMDPQALNYLGENWLQQVANLHAPELWNHELKRACAFLAHIREIIESQTLSGQQMVVHALLHHWMGRFHAELKECDEGVSQLEIAIRMGARPVESHLLLGRAYADAGALAKAERAYLGAYNLASQHPKPAGAGMEPRQAEVLKDIRPLDELKIEALLRLAILYASTGTRLRRAGLLAALAERNMRDAKLFRTRRREFQALQHQALGRILIQHGQIDASINELELSRELCSSASTCYHLAKAYDAKARKARDKDSARERVVALCDEASRLDIPRRYQQRLDDLREHIGNTET